ncbi:MAG: hypothetical protein HY765_05600 [Rhodomicrobium sp.]|nr:hypothetical protein [Rhodomicrobium sp.]
MILRTAVTGAIVLGFAAAANSAHAGYKPDHDNGPAASAPLKHRHRLARRRPPYRNCCGAYRFVYAESWYGFKKVVAPVRHAEHGDQVRLPGGTWVYCEFSCEYTLRRQSLDFWQGQGAGPNDQVSPGYFRWDFYID